MTASIADFMDFIFYMLSIFLIFSVRRHSLIVGLVSYRSYRLGELLCVAFA